MLPTAIEDFSGWFKPLEQFGTLKSKKISLCKLIEKHIKQYLAMEQSKTMHTVGSKTVRELEIIRVKKTRTPCSIYLLNIQSDLRA